MNRHDSMPLTLKQILFLDYPIPEQLSVWGGDGIVTHPLVDLDAFIETSLMELASDIAVVDYCYMGGNTLQLPNDTLNVIGARFDMAYQGNRSVKVTYNPYNKTVNCRFVPCVVTFRRKLSLDNISKLGGNQLIYVKKFILAKMADKELTMLGTVNLNADNGSIDLDSLKSFRDECRSYVENAKGEIMMYAVGN